MLLLLWKKCTILAFKWILSSRAQQIFTVLKHVFKYAFDTYVHSKLSSVEHPEDEPCKELIYDTKVSSLQGSSITLYQ